MSESSQSSPSLHARVGEESNGAEESGAPDTLPVLASGVQIAPRSAGAAELSESRRTVIPAVQAAAVAAGGFVAGAAMVGLVHRRQRRSRMLASPGRRRAAGPRLARRAGTASSSRAAELVQIVGSRSLLVDVHLLGAHHDS